MKTRTGARLGIDQGQGKAQDRDNDRSRDKVGTRSRGKMRHMTGQDGVGQG